MSKAYYDWPKIMAKKSDRELKEIYNDKRSISIEKANAAEQELINRGILSNKGRKRLIVVHPKVSYKAAILLREGNERYQIINKLIEDGSSKEEAKIVADELKIWNDHVKKREKKLLGVGIFTVFVFISLIIRYGIIPVIVVGGLGALSNYIMWVETKSPKRFKERKIVYYEKTSE